jgi:hypothetical protein
VVPDGTPPVEVANPVTDYVPSARPGGRAPHAWLERAGARVSTIDLIGRRFVLLGSGEAWAKAAEGTPVLDVVTVGDSWELRDPGAQWHAAYGLERGGGVLVRPDGHVAWRSPGPVSDPAAAVRAALASVLGYRA